MAVGLWALAVASSDALATAPLRDEFIFWVDPTGQYVDESSYAPVNSGPSAVVEMTEYGLKITCDSYLYSEEGLYYNLGMQARVLRPGGGQIGTGINGAYKAQLHVNAFGFDNDPATGTYTCETDAYVNGQFIGQMTSFVNVIRLLPTSLSVHSDSYLNQSFDNYNREIHYQVRNQFNEALTVQGLSVTEQYALQSDSCTRNPIVTGTASTNGDGRFLDNYYVNGSGNPGCQQNASCTTVYTQQLRVAGILVRTNGVTFGCNAVTITPQ